MNVIFAYMKRITILASLFCLCIGAGAQSDNFTLGKWTEIHTAMLKELSKS